MRNKYKTNHVLYRDGIYYYVRRLPYDLTSRYDVKRLCFSLKTKSASAAIRASKSINQRLEDYWLGLRLQNMDIPAIQVVKSSDSVINDGLLLSQACELYLRLKSVGKDKVFTRTAKRNTNYVTQLSGHLVNFIICNKLFIHDSIFLLLAYILLSKVIRCVFSLFQFCV